MSSSGRAGASERPSGCQWIRPPPSGCQWIRPGKDRRCRTANVRIPGHSGPRVGASGFVQARRVRPTGLWTANVRIPGRSLAHAEALLALLLVRCWPRVQVGARRSRSIQATRRCRSRSISGCAPVLQQPCRKYGALCCAGRDCSRARPHAADQHSMSNVPMTFVGLSCSTAVRSWRAVVCLALLVRSTPSAASCMRLTSALPSTAGASMTMWS